MSDSGAGGTPGGGEEPRSLGEFLSQYEAEGDEPAPLLSPRQEPPGPGRDVAVAAPASPGAAAPGWLEEHERRRRRGFLLGGVAVTALGLALFVVIATGVSFWGTLFLAPAVLLLVLAAAWRPYYWLYLPGFALLGFGLGWIVDGALEPEPDVWLSWIGLGAGLLVAWGLRLAQGRRGHWLAPVAGATIAGAGLLAAVDDPWAIVWKGWPLVLVAIGVALVVRALTMGRRKRGGSGPPAVR